MVEGAHEAVLREILEIPGNQAVYERLRELLASRSATAFVGAGASFPLYPLWGEFIAKLAHEPVRLDLAVAADEEEWLRAAASNPLQAVSQIRDCLKDQLYHDFLHDTFKRRVGADGQSYSPSQGALIRARFKAYVTTNYDPGLLEARRSLDPERPEPEFIVWNQNFQVNQWLSGELPKPGAPCPVLFAHGHYVEPQNIVLDQESYRRAYRDTPYRLLFNNLWVQENLVFVGFSFDDVTLAQIADEVLQQTQRQGGGKPRHVAIMGLPVDRRYTREMRRKYLDLFGAQVLFYPVGRTADGHPDHSALQVVLDSLAASPPPPTRLAPTPEPAPQPEPRIPPAPADSAPEPAQHRAPPVELGIRNATYSITDSAVSVGVDLSNHSAAPTQVTEVTLEIAELQLTLRAQPAPPNLISLEGWLPRPPFELEANRLRRGDFFLRGPKGCFDGAPRTGSLRARLQIQLFGDKPLEQDVEIEGPAGPTAPAATGGVPTTGARSSWEAALADLVLRCEVRERGLVVWLQNAGLEPARLCMLGLTDLQEWAPQREGFTRNPFTPISLVGSTEIRGQGTSPAHCFAYLRTVDKSVLRIQGAKADDPSFEVENAGIWRAELQVSAFPARRVEELFFEWTPGSTPRLVRDPRDPLA